MVTDRPNPEEPSTSAAADPPGPSHEEPAHAIGLETGPYPGEPPATHLEPNPEYSSSGETGSGAHGSNVSPKVILPKSQSKKAQNDEPWAFHLMTPLIMKQKMAWRTQTTEKINELKN